MNGRTTLLLLLTVVAMVGVPAALALPQYLDAFNTTYPGAVGSRIDTCELCHLNPAGGGTKNPYGLDFQNQSIHSTNASQALINIQGNDSDKDGFINIDEINNLTFPGNASDHPAIVTPTATATVSPTATANVTPTATANVTPTATATVTPTVTATVTATATATATVTPGVTPTVTATPTPTPVITAFELTPNKTAVLSGNSVDITIKAISANITDTSFNGTANITINASKNAGAVTSPVDVNFTGGMALLTVTSNITQLVTVTAANGSITGNTTVAFADKVFDLSKGWNLISIPNFADPSSVGLILKNVKNNGVVGYDPATNNFSTPTDLLPLYGYWINVTDDNQSLGFIASTNITLVPPSRKLYEGWNLIGVSASKNDPDTLNASELFEDLKFGPDHTQWMYSRLVSFEQPLSPVTLVAGKDLSDDTSLKQGHGYWLFIKTVLKTNVNNVPWAGKQW